MASPLKDRIQKSMTDAMKAKDAARLSTLRLIFNAVRKKEIDDRKDLVDAEIEKLLMTMAKQIGETLDQARGAGRADSVAESEAELKIVKEFLPEALSPEALQSEINSIVSELRASGALATGPAAMGAIMKAVMNKVGGRADGKAIQEAVKKALA